MNDKIIELAKKSLLTEWFWLNPNLNGIHYQSEKEAIESFAELIVRECIDILNPEGDLTSMREEYGRKLSMNIIKEHFGVEE